MKELRKQRLKGKEKGSPQGEEQMDETQTSSGSKKRKESNKRNSGNAMIVHFSEDDETVTMEVQGMDTNFVGEENEADSLEDEGELTPEDEINFNESATVSVDY